MESLESPARLSRFLRSHRLRLSPEELGLDRAPGGRDRPGLLPAELADAAGLDAAGYGDIEDGRAGRVSLSALDALARALRLDPGERAELFRLGAPPGECRLRGPAHLTRAVPTLPVVAINHRYEVTGWNLPGQALLAWHLDWPAATEVVPPNLARMLFLDPRTRALYRAWPTMARAVVAELREAADRGRDERLHALVVELAASSGEFADLWFRPDRDRTGPFGCGSTIAFTHPAVGAMDLARVVLDQGAETAERALVFSPEPESESAAALAELLSRVSG
ncbi:helix-turn-helix domain-containing protein (plasmid) [Streptomyces sp. BI20]|uniref:MmyB family transcriptional regulator n=1 Tax=Streptomyces sp. BI20 TaxID=3403460 RepID=UPI003C776A88